MRATGMFEAVDLHVGGAPVRLVQSGYPELGGGALETRAARAAATLDGHRRRLLQEPWGATGLEAAVITAPVRAGADAGLLFLSQDGYPERSGRTALAAATWLWRAGRAGAARAAAGAAGTVVLDTPAGLVAVAIEDAGADAAPLARLASPPAVEALWHDAADARVVRVGGASIVVAFAREGAAGVDSAALASAAARLDGLRSSLGSVSPGPVQEWLLAAPPAGGGAWAVVAYDGQGRLLRAPTFEGLAALALHLAAEGWAAPDGAFAVHGLADVPVTVRLKGGSGETGLGTTLEARAYVTALRRFLPDPDDEVAPFLVP